MSNTQFSYDERKEQVTVDRITTFSEMELGDLCQATEDAIRDGIGFNWVTPPQRDMLEAYWRGVLVVPERVVFGGWLDGTLAGAIQLLKPGKSNQTRAFSATISCHFVAPWARGHGMAKQLLHAAEEEAQSEDFSVLNLSVRETQKAAIKLYEEEGYTRWGILPVYEQVEDNIVAGHFFYKNIKPVIALS